MDANQFLGYLITGIITLGGFIAIVYKFTQPINDLKVVIQELKDTLNSMRENNKRRDDLIEDQGREIKDLRERVGGLEVKVNMYHHDE
jgi:tRNA threonylcarbamoyladenosine modification (KEOPS) complex Cgi121 subunit